MTVLPSGGVKQVLIVNGFDRFERTQDFRYPYAYTGDGLVDRVWSRYNNSFDYVVQVHNAIHAARPGVHIASTSNEAVISGVVNLTDYDTVIWILGEESTANDTFDFTEQTKVEQFIAAGGNLFLSGAEIGWDLDQQNNGRSFYENTLKGNYVSDDAGTYTATVTAGGIFAGLPNITFSNGSGFSNLDAQYYNVDTPDVIAPQTGAQAALNYSGGAGGAAAIQAAGTDGRGSLVMFAFPFEVITSAARRQDVIDRVFTFFNLTAPAPADNADFSGDTTVDGADFLAWQRGLGSTGASQSAGDANSDGDVDAADLEIWRSQYNPTPPVEEFASAALVAGDESVAFMMAALPSASDDIFWLAQDAGSTLKAGESPGLRFRREHNPSSANPDLSPIVDRPTTMRLPFGVEKVFDGTLTREDHFASTSVDSAFESIDDNCDLRHQWAWLDNMEP
jgi:hypothetical protein